MTAAPADPPLPTDAELMARAARAGTPLFKVLQDPGPLRPLLAAVAVLPAVLAGPRCGLHAVDPAWGLACLDAAAGETGPLDAPGGPAAWVTGRWLAVSAADAAAVYFALSWAGTTLLVWAVWQLAAAALSPRAAAFAALLTATNPLLAAVAASAVPAGLSVGCGVAAAWLWVRALAEPGTRGRPPSFGAGAAAGATAGLATVLAGPAAAAVPAAVVAASLPADLFGRRGGRLPGLAGVLAGAAAPAAVGTVSAPPLTAAPPPAWSLLALAGMTLPAAWLLARRPPWLGRKAVVAAGGAAAGAAAAAGWSWLRGGVGAAAPCATLAAAALLAAVSYEAACRPALPTRVATLLTALPAALYAAGWAWTGDAAAIGWRAAFLALAAVAGWGVWQTAAHGVAPAVRSRRLLIGAVLALAAGGVWLSVRDAAPAAGRGERRLLAALADPGGPADVVVLADPADQPAAQFLARAAIGGRAVTVLAPDEPKVADAVLNRVAAGGGPAVAAVGGRAAAWLDSLFPGQTVSLTAAGAVGGNAVRLARFPRRDGG